MSRRKSRVFMFLMAVVLGGLIAAAPAAFAVDAPEGHALPLGSIGGFTPATGYGLALNADASLGVGIATGSGWGDPYFAVAWDMSSPDKQMIALCPEYIYGSWVTDINGRKVVGNRMLTTGWDSATHGFWKDVGAPVAADLAPPDGSAPGASSEAHAVDGNIAVGGVSGPSIGSDGEAAWWSMASGTPVVNLIPGLPGQGSEAVDVVGTVVVGRTNGPTGMSGWYYDVASGDASATMLAGLTGAEYESSVATGLRSDGLVVGLSSLGMAERAALWDISDPENIAVYDLGLFSRAMEPRFDGDYILGSSWEPEGYVKPRVWKIQSRSPLMVEELTLDLKLDPAPESWEPADASGDLLVGTADYGTGVRRAFVFDLSNQAAGATLLGPVADYPDLTCSMVGGISGNMIIGNVMPVPSPGEYRALPVYWTLADEPPADAQSATQDIRDEFAALSPSAEDESRFDDVIVLLDKALAEESWIDGSHLQPGKPGQRVFSAYSAALLALRGIRDGNTSGYSAGEIQALIDSLMSQVRQLAQTATDDAMERTSESNKKVLNAQKELESGDFDYANDALNNAADHYATAWSTALSAK